MTTPETVTVEALLQRLSSDFDAAELYFGHGTDNAWDEACWLLESVLRKHGREDVTREMLLTMQDAAMQEIEQLARERIATRKPLAYLLHEAWFCELPFYVDDRVLVPRSPLAELIANGFDALIDPAPSRILDLCTGSGCIGIACALVFPEAEVVLTDLSGDALEVARINISRFNLQDRVTCVQSDLFADVNGCFDLIISNPPYVGQNEYASLPAEYRNEPAMGLLAENEGLAIPLQILSGAAQFLSPEGSLILETGATWQALDAAREDLPFLWLEFAHGGEGVCLLRRRDLLLQPA